MPILVSGISGFPQAHTQSYKRFATVVKKWGKHWNAISAPNVAVWHVPCNKTSEQVPAGRCQHHQSAGLSAKTPRSWTPVWQAVKGLQLSDCLLLEAAPYHESSLTSKSQRDALGFCYHGTCSYPFCCECSQDELTRLHENSLQDTKQGAMTSCQLKSV